MNATVITTAGSVLVALVAGFFGFRGSTGANKVRQTELQQAFTQQVMQEVDRVRQQAAAAQQDAAKAKADNEALEIRHRHLRRDMDAMQDWVDRVVRARDTYMRDLEARGSSVEDSGVIRLLRAINGGPHTGE